MPYIAQEDRPRVLETLKPQTTGELNFFITRIIMEFLDSQGKKSYANMSAIRGVLADVSTEFYRRVMAPYEDDKRALNGDVY